ncbi:HAD-IA family hydrolase [Sulfitobacter aestuariivivens]|uniref:HAD-IA family hydrolase n=1 Tax=Sulfitobacter aestuariivivens TaxID=2766981 RepID=A0A927HGI8_9RHOB|nr:HAD-IA family hydrolase [Sulfitobacter aestuariivivens]MBD3666026.1 HAD-IA family hydrolase [Sulfitobacter aestuariivivens]
MSAPLRLVIFDVDGTLVDSQGDIVAAMTAAFQSVDQAPPDRKTILGVVGLSLDVIMPRLLPALSDAAHARMVEAYKAAYMTLRASAGVAQSSPLYPGALDALRGLNAVPEVLLGVATGKSRRGLDKLIEGHRLDGLFVTQQVADHHPSKPHPSMILQALSDTGVDPHQAVVVGDTSFDMEMAAAAGVRGIGVSWGYHDRARLAGAAQVIDAFSQLRPALDAIWGVPA